MTYVDELLEKLSHDDMNNLVAIHRSELLFSQENQELIRSLERLGLVVVLKIKGMWIDGYVVKCAPSNLGIQVINRIALARSVARELDSF